MSGEGGAPLGAGVVRPAGAGSAGAADSDGLGDVAMGHPRPRLSAEALDRLDMLPTTRLGPDQRGAAVNLDLALGDLQEGAIFAPEDTPAPTEHDLASLGNPFFQVRDPLEAARVNEFRLKYRSFRQGNAKGSKGEMKDVVSAKMNPFLTKLLEMLSDPSCQEYISWTDNGSGIILKQLDLFSATVLPRFFNHSNFTSFLRQLNMHNFYTSAQKRGEWRIFTNPLFTREGTNEPARGKRKLGQDKPASTKRARRGSSSPASRAGTPADTNGEAPTPGGGSKAGGDSGGRLSRGSGNGTSAGGTTRAAPRARRRGRAGKSALDAVKAAASVGHNAAGLLPGAAGFLAMTGAVPLTVDAMRSALGGQRAKAAATGVRRRIDVRSFVTSLMDRQHVLETRLQLAEESHTALLNGYSRLTSELQDMRRLHKQHDAAVQRLRAATANPAAPGVDGAAATPAASAAPAPAPAPAAAPAVSMAPPSVSTAAPASASMQPPNSRPMRTMPAPLTPATPGFLSALQLTARDDDDGHGRRTELPPSSAAAGRAPGTRIDTAGPMTYVPGLTPLSALSANLGEEYAFSPRMLMEADDTMGDPFVTDDMFSSFFTPSHGQQQ